MSVSSQTQDLEKPEKVSVVNSTSDLQAPPKPPPAVNPPPDGGLQAWLQVAGGFFLFFNSWGILNAFGVYQTYYESGELIHASSSEISWVGGLTAFLLLFTSLFVGPVFDRGYLRALIAVGTFLIVLGNMTLSVSHELYQIVLSQGVALGIGTGCLFVPCISTTQQWFSKRLGLATGIAVSGSALGGVIYPIVLNKLLVEVGFGWATRAIGFIALGTLALPLATMKQRVKPPRPRALLDFSAFKDGPFMIFVVATFMNFLGLFILIFYLPYYGKANGITDTSLTFYLVTLFNAGSFFGRLVPNIIADKTGPFNLLAPASIITGITMYCVLAIHSVAGMIVMSLVTGFMSGALIGLPPLCLISIARSGNKLPLLGTRMGMAYAMISFGVLAGGPSAGAVLGTSEPLNWTGTWILGGTFTLASGVLLYVLRFWTHGMNFTTKA